MIWSIHSSILSGNEGSNSWQCQLFLAAAVVVDGGLAAVATNNGWRRQWGGCWWPDLGAAAASG
jgi:hypothetical protein